MWFVTVAVTGKNLGGGEMAITAPSVNIFGGANI